MACFVAAPLALKATSHSINIGNFVYSPATLYVQVGDTVNIQASDMHPCMQVSKTDWASGTTTALPAGWGSKNANFFVVIADTNAIYYLCANHGPDGMKGRILNGTNNLKTHSAIANSGISVFPNPATDVIHFTSKSNLENGQWKLIDLQGKIAMQGTVTANQTQVQVAELKGIYLLLITDKNGILQSRHRVVVRN